MSINSRTNGNMYEDFITWNPFKGCEYDCTYCIPSFQRQAKRQKHLCSDCYSYKPHFHEERLLKVPASSNIFACGNGDISFCPDDQLQMIIEVIHQRSSKTFLLQSKDPSTFERIKDFPSNLIIGTTIETDREDIYKNVSKAPLPKDRIKSFTSIKHDRKMITIEPILKFKHDIMCNWIKKIDPELVWLGFDTKNTPWLISPSVDEAMTLYKDLVDQGYEVKLKHIPGRSKLP